MPGEVDNMKLMMSETELNNFLKIEFPQMADRFEIISSEPFRMQVGMTMGEADLRPGGTVSGPAMFALADCTYYMATLAMIGPQALMVTTSCTINFMRKPLPGKMTADARILKLGRSLSVGDVLLYSQGKSAPVAHASLTYSIPPK